MTEYKHSASDKKLDHAASDAQDAKDAAKSTDSHHGGPGHDADKVSKHDDHGKDRLFEGRQQHDDAERKSEKNRLAKDVAKHDHAEDASGHATTGTTAKPG
jgi:hypothetical protein